jgi:tetratricopeptide (TPR) repeat protein
VRYRLLETVRHYAREQLEAAAEAQAAQDRHLEWYVGLAEEGVAGLGGPDQLAWLNRLEIEHDNFRAALAWSVQAPSGAARAVQLVGALARFWSVRGHLSEGRAWCARALAMPGETPAPLRARALHGAGSLAHEQGSYRQARSLHEESLQLQRALGGARGIAASVANLGAIALFEGDYKRARALFEESLALQRDLDNTYGVAIMLNNLAEITKIQGDYAGAEALYDESLALHQGIENQLGIAMVLGNKADLARVRKEYDRSARLLAESLELRQRLGEQRLIADALLSLGQLALDQGDHSLAGIQLLKSLPIRQKIGDRRGTAYGLEGLAALAIATGDAAWAAHLAGAAMSIRDTINAPLLPYERPSHEQCLDRMRVALGDEQFTAAQAGGYRDGLDQIMAVVLAPAGADLEGAHSTAGAV